MDSEALRPYIDWYKAHFATIFDREGYKWESIQTFQSYSAAKNEYYPVLKEAFKKSKNLLNSRSVFSLGMMLDIVTYSKEHPEITPSGLDLFYDLFEGFTGKETHERILDKITFFRQHIREYVRKYMPDKKNDYQDLHAVSVYLSHRYPDKFYIYRTYEFTQFNKLLNNEFSFKWGKDSNYISYLNMCDQLNAILRQELKIDKGFRIIVDKLTKENPNCYDDPEYRLLTQDFIYSVVSYYNTFIVILVGLLAAFSILGYFHLKHVSKNEMIILLKEMIRESKDFENTMKGYAAGWFDYSEDLEDLNNKIAEIKNDLENLPALNIEGGTENGDKRKKTVNEQI